MTYFVYYKHWEFEFSTYKEDNIILNFTEVLCEDDLRDFEALIKHTKHLYGTVRIQNFKILKG